MLKVVSTSRSGMPLGAPDRLDRPFYDRSCRDLARALLGQVLCRRLSPELVAKGRIVETEMYPGSEDQASHSHQARQTPRNKAMFMEPGTAYVYSIYGIYYCFNISSHEKGGAVLIRALEPVECDPVALLPVLQENRSSRSKSNAQKPLRELYNGPSKLCLTMSITRKNVDQIDLTTADQIWLEPGVEAVDHSDVIEAKRIGIDSQGSESVNRLYRFYLKNNHHVSDYKSKKRGRTS